MAFVHICSSHCMMEQACGSRLEQPVKSKKCCSSKHKKEADKQVDRSCECISVTYQADFYADASHFVLPQATCFTLGYSRPFVYAFVVPEHEVVSESPAHAPPSPGREILALHSVLII